MIEIDGETPVEGGAVESHGVTLFHTTTKTMVDFLSLSAAEMRGCADRLDKCESEVGDGIRYLSTALHVLTNTFSIPC